MSVPFSELLVVGHVRRAHGLKGEVVVRLSTNRAERLDVGSRLMATDRELTVKSARSKDGDYLVFFEGIGSREAADEIRGTELRAEPLDDPDELWVHELIGAMVRDQHGTDHGLVSEVHVNPASDLLVLESGSLVPVVFIADVIPAVGEAAPAVVLVEVPSGLFDL